MANDAPVSCGKYLLYPLALLLPQTGKWQALVIVTRGNESNAGNAPDGISTLPHSKSFPAVPVVFDDEESARAYALRYGQMLVAGHFKELPP